MAPVFLAKAAYNPKAVNRLLAFEKTKFKSTDAMEKAATLLIDDVVRRYVFYNEYEGADRFRVELENSIDVKKGVAMTPKFTTLFHKHRRYTLVPVSRLCCLPAQSIAGQTS